MVVTASDLRKAVAEGLHIVHVAADDYLPAS